MAIVLETNLSGVNLFRKGKVRDVYDLGDQLLIVATDRISTFDVVLNDAIPDKGRVLSGLSSFWFEFTKDIIPNHLISADISQYPEQLRQYAEILAGRSMLVKRTKPLPVECIVRGYVSGSGWQDYQKTGAICGIRLPDGLTESEKLSAPIFTPSTKAEIGHDQNISEQQMIDLVGAEITRTVKKACFNIYLRAAKYAESKGIIIADTKMEFGILDDQIILIDELLTPDSSRFWDITEYKVGMSPPSYDKQFVRDYLISIKWDKKPPIPKLPPDVIEKTQEKYRLAFEKITGHSMSVREIV
ncbi:MAG: phosphoribosylaminoimidazolesuccinocarboxamide synthase [Candidatus Latescibacteria bacterium]|nr:phosphoribosylaminoimidazolesuccinocarboxamide synthase [Candidatus Latescibacterota bacterium]